MVVDAKITTAAGDAKQKEIFILVKQDSRWLVDELIVTDEEVELDDYNL